MARLRLRRPGMTGTAPAAERAPQLVGIEPPIAEGREKHHPTLDERFAAAPPKPENPTPVEAMPHRLKILRKEALRPPQAARRTGVRHH
jgi:hypothetical protein